MGNIHLEGIASCNKQFPSR